MLDDGRQAPVVRQRRQRRGRHSHRHRARRPLPARRAAAPAISLSDNASASPRSPTTTASTQSSPARSRRSAPGGRGARDLDQRQLAERARGGASCARARGPASIGLTGRRRRRARRASATILIAVPSTLHAAHPGGTHPHRPRAMRAGRAQDALTAVFLDRDGVINRKAPEGSYVTSLATSSFLPGALEGLRLPRGLGGSARRRDEPARNRARAHE